MKFSIIIFALLGASVSAIALDGKPRLASLEGTGVIVVQNSTIQANHTIAPQESERPSESPKPSPSPSSSPSWQPSSTTPPTKHATDIPSESPKPSPSPSGHPSLSPSDIPTNIPSVFPSFDPTFLPSENPSRIPSTVPSLSAVPSDVPTLSFVPSGTPSVLPTSTPSLNPSSIPSNLPSLSLEPTFTPSTGLPSVYPSEIPTMIPSDLPSSHAPSTVPSDLPSILPTIYSRIQSAILGVTLDLHDTLGPDLRTIFEEQTKQFLETQLTSDMPPMDNITIDILFLKIVEQTVIPARRVLRNGRELHAAGLRIRFNVTGECKPGNLPEKFHFANAVGRPFRENYPVYLYRLHSVHDTFSGLADSPTTSASTGNDYDGTQTTAGGVVAGIVVASLGSVALAIFAGIYAVRSKRSDDSTVAKPLVVDMFEIERADSHSTSMTPYNEKEKLSPRSFESRKGSGGSGRSGRSGMSSKDLRSNPRSLLDDMIEISKEGSHSAESCSPNSKSDLGLKLTSAVLGAHGGVKNNYRAGSDPPAFEKLETSNNRVESLCYSEDDNTSCGSTPTSVDLTPHSVTGDKTPSSIFSGLGQLGARPLGPGEQQHYQQDAISVASSFGEVPVKRTGLYDVFAPSGPLGIVVDTTRDGPVVHSMKPTSPLLGLITPGDLIVGLDDMDTRSMTAATLTRLMAKRSHQAERKITLLAIEPE